MAKEQDRLSEGHENPRNLLPAQKVKLSTEMVYVPNKW